MNEFRARGFMAVGLLALLSAILWAAPSDSPESLPPPLFRGTILVHFPLGAIPADSAGGSYIWIPIPEMGFKFCPTISSKAGDGWWEFPIHILTFFPFLEKYAALGDISIGVGYRVPPLYYFGFAYRFIEGRFYPVKAEFYAHIVEGDFSLPIRGFSGAGARIAWVVHTNLDMGAPYVSQNEVYDHYEGSAFAIAPYWKMPLKYGQITLAYRVVISSSLIGTGTQKQNSYQVQTRSISAIEVNYTYP